MAPADTGISAAGERPVHPEQRVTNMLLFPFLLVLSLTCTAEAADNRFFLWMDGHANMERLGTVEGINRVMDSSRAVGVTDVVIDVKPVDGFVLYRSAFAPLRSEWRGKTRDSGFPYVETMIGEARKRGMRAHLALNVFAEGHKVFRSGRAYDDSTVRSWAMTVYSPAGLRSIIETKDDIAVFVNPILAAVQRYELNIIGETAQKFRPDGIILDRCRYTGITTDFGDSSRESFEQFIGKRVDQWPEEILTFASKGGGPSEYVRGPLFKPWVEWRASVIAGFFRKARQTVKAVDPTIQFGDYVGAWYPPYFEVGVNWASSTYDPSVDYDWATPAYAGTGYAGLLDFLLVGTYFYEVEIAELNAVALTPSQRGEAGMKLTKEPWYSVEGSANLAMKVTGGATPVHGSLYVDQYKDHPDQFLRAVRMARSRTNGLMIFDLVHIDTYEWWEVLREGWRMDE